MKKLLLILSFFVFLFNACKEDDKLLFLDVDPGPSDFIFTNLEGEQSFTVVSNANWTISSNSAWCVVNTKAGTGNSVIKVSVMKNSGYSQRDAIITLSALGVDERPAIAIKQDGLEPVFTITNPSGFMVEGGTDTLNISGNVTWTAQLDENSKSWCSISAESGGKIPYQFVITAAANNNPSSRKAVLTFTADQFPEPVVKEVVQLGENPELSINPDSMSTSGGEKIVEVNVTSNLTYTISPDVTWIEKVETTPQSRTLVTKIVAFKISANATDANRKGTVSFTSGSEVVKFTVDQSSLKTDVAADSVALLEIYNKSKDINAWISSISGNWGTNHPIKTWKGVVVNSDGRVVELTLGNIGQYSGTGVALTADMDFSALSELSSLVVCTRTASEIPTSIGKLSKLQELRIKSGIMTGSEYVAIPGEIYNLTDLRSLELSSYATNRNSSFISGEISKDIAKLTKLESLILNGNYLTKIPNEISALKELTVFCMQYNMGNMMLPDALCTLSALKQLKVNNSGISGTIPANIGNLTNLEILNLSNNEFDYSAKAGIPETIEKLTKLTELHLNNSRLTGPIPANIGNLKELTIINLNNNKFLVGTQEVCPGITGQIPESIGSLIKLKTLNVMMNSLTGTLPGGMGNLKELTQYTLNITKNKFTGVGAGFGALKMIEINFSDNEIASVSESNFPNATTLNFTNNLLVATGFPATITAPLLVTFNASNNKLGSIPAGLLSISTLANINLISNPLDADEMEDANMSALVNLKTLMLSNNTGLTSIPASLATAPALTILNMTNCRVASIPDVTFPNITSLTLDKNEMTELPANINKFTALKSLSLNDNKLTSVPDLLADLSGLNSLYLNNNDITVIPDGLSALEYLFLNGNSVSSIPSGLTSLKTLSMNNNKLTSIQKTITDEMLELSNLSLENNLIAGEIPLDMKKLGKLSVLVLQNNRLTGLIPAVFGAEGMKSLATLNVLNNRLTGIAFAEDEDMLLAFKKIRSSLCPQKDAGGNIVTPCPIVIP